MTFCSSTRPHFNPKSQNFLIFCLKSQNGKYLVYELAKKTLFSGSLIWAKIRAKISSASSTVIKKSVQQALNLALSIHSRTSRGINVAQALASTIRSAHNMSEERRDTYVYELSRTKPPFSARGRTLLPKWIWSWVPPPPGFSHELVGNSLLSHVAFLAV